MSDAIQVFIQAQRLLQDAEKSLLGYFLANEWSHWRGQVLQRMHQAAQAPGPLAPGQPTGPDAAGTPTAPPPHSLPPATRAELQELSWLCGLYFFLLASHKKANFSLLNHADRPRVLYLRGYDYQAVVNPAPGLGMGLTTPDTSVFNTRVGRHLAPLAEVFKVMSPQDLQDEVTGRERQFDGHYDEVIRTCSTPIRSLYLQAQRWQQDVAWLAQRVDHAVVYLSSITDSVLWELHCLQGLGLAGRSTVFFDRPAILTKGLHSDIHAQLDTMNVGNVVWRPNKKRSTEADIDALQTELAQTFTVVPAADFEASVPALAQRLRTEPPAQPLAERIGALDFHFHPALPAEHLQSLHDLDAALWLAIDPASAEPLPSLAWHSSLAQLRLYTALLRGQHADAARALAVYAGDVDAALQALIAQGTSNNPDDWPPGSLPDRLDQHRSASLYFAEQFFSSGGALDFGNHLAEAQASTQHLALAARQRATQGWINP